MQMQQAEREVQQRNALNRAYSEAYTPEGLDYNKLTSSLATGGFGSQIPAIQEQRFKTQKAETEQKKAQAELLTSKLQQSRSFLDTLDPTLPDAAQRYLSWHEANHADPVIGPALAARGVTVDTARAEIDQALQTPNGLQNLINRSAMGIEKFMQFVKPSTIQVDRGGETLLVETAPGQAPRTVGRFATSMTPAQLEQAARDQQRLQNERQRLSFEERRVIQEELKNTPEFKELMARSQELGKLIAKNDEQALSALPVVISKANQAVQLIDEMIGKRNQQGDLLEGEKPHAGFKTTVGVGFPGARFVPGSPAADFMTYFDQVTGQSFLEAFETLKGGGQITEIEGQKATSAINRMSIASSEKEFVKAAIDLQTVIKAGAERAQKKAATAQKRMTGETPVPSTGRFLGIE
jgi:hypothetical protein